MTDDWLTTPGWSMEPEERAWLLGAAAEAAERFGTSSCIVNIGVALGASVHCLRAGAPAARLVAIDVDNSLFQGDAGAEMVTADSAATGQEWKGAVHLLFVDGDHSRAGVEADLAAWLGHVAPGGVVAFHDYYSELEHVAGVREAIDGHVWGPGWEDVTALPPVGSLKAFRRRSLRAGDPFGKLAVGVPYWKSSWPFFQWWSYLLIGGFEPGDEVLLDVPGEMPMPRSHNAIVQEFLRGSADTLCLIEDDHCGDQDVARRMRFKADNLPFDVVCASYVNRRGTPVPMGWRLANDGRPNEHGYACQFDIEGVQLEGTQEYDGAALGLALIRRWVLEAMLAEQGGDPESALWFESYKANSLDIPFYVRAWALGARVAVDRDNWIGHVGQYVWTKADFLQARERMFRNKNGRRSEEGA